MRDLTGTLPKALLLLKYMAKHPREVSFQELKNHSGLSANVLSRILKTYIEWDFFSKDPKTGYYGLASETYSLAKEIVSSRSLKELVDPIVKSLASELEESAAYFDFSDDWVNLLSKAEVPNSYHYLELMTREIHTPDNAFFACALAYLTPEQRELIMQQCSQLKIELTEEDFSRICEVGGLVREETYKRSNITRICTPVFNGEEMVGVIGVTVLSHSLSEEEKLSLLKTCQHFSKRLSEQF
jgi:DNA-binding IclR family transcriptional regulator